MHCGGLGAAVASKKTLREELGLVLVEGFRNVSGLAYSGLPGDRVGWDGLRLVSG